MSVHLGDLRVSLDRYGIGEWFGHVVSTQGRAQLKDLAQKSKSGLRAAPCPFRQAADKDVMCNKRGGVCSMQVHRQLDTGEVVAVGSFVAMCPSRFWQDNNIFRWVGEAVLGTSSPTVIREVDFLETVNEVTDENDDDASGEDKKAQKERDAVGRIDMVLVHPDEPHQWCALELQAVYFSGTAMSSHLAQYENADGLVFPDANRRPDFRSSGPKRLMPQLQTKVPTLRRWGRKMAVVIDKAFFASLGPMSKVPHLSNSDIAWFVVDFHPTSGAMTLVQQIYTTLESSVEALTAGLPKSQEAFEKKLQDILASGKKSMKKKVLRVASPPLLSGS